MATRPGQKIDTDNDSELALLRRIAGQDRDAITELYRLYHPRLFRFNFRLTQSHGTADELVNDIMLIVWRTAGTFRGESRVSTWIFGIAYRQAMRRIRRQQITLSAGFDPDEFPAEELNNLENRDWVQHGLRALPTAQQLTVLLVFYAGMSYPEVAEVTECPVNTVKTRMFHARRKLRELLAESASPGLPADEAQHD